MPRKGWVFIETVATMVLLAFLATVFAVGVNRQQTALMHLRNSRAAVHLAEATLSDRSFPMPPDSRVAVHPLTAASRPSAGLVWIKVTATVDGRSAELIGLSTAGGQP
jgi:hypothetical protein